MAFLKESGLM